MQKLLLTLAVSFALVATLSSVSAEKKEKASKEKVTKQEKKADSTAAKSAKKPKAKTAVEKKKADATSTKPGKKAPRAKADKGKKKTATAKTQKGSKAKGKAKKGKAKKGKAKKGAIDSGVSSDDVAKANENLSSKDPELVLEAIQVLGASGKKESATPLMELLKAGPRSDITDAVLYSLGGIGNEDSIDLLIAYLGHRRPDARIAALFALEKFKADRVSKAIEQALRDSDRQVRASAALALGKRGDAGSVPMLFRAFERGVTDAAISIGQLGKPEDSKRLATHLGRADIKILLAGFEEFLNRDDFPEDAKISILNRLFDLAGPEVWRFAVTYKATFPPDTDENDNKLYKLVSRMVRQIKDK